MSKALLSTGSRWDSPTHLVVIGVAFHCHG